MHPSPDTLEFVSICIKIKITYFGDDTQGYWFLLLKDLITMEKRNFAVSLTLQFLIMNCWPSIFPGSLPVVLPSSFSIVKSAGSGLSGLSLKQKRHDIIQFLGKSLHAGLSAGHT